MMLFIHNPLGNVTLFFPPSPFSAAPWLLSLSLLQIKRMVGSYVGQHKEFNRQYQKGIVELELVPQVRQRLQ